MENPQKLKSLPELSGILETARTNGKKIIFTNGCFDILHRGHASYLRAAKALGDLLVVGLNADASVKRLKGPERPINNEADRAYLLESLACVDYVVIFTEDTPYELLSVIKPDVLVKGGDYQIDQVVGREFAGAVQLISFVEGYSTTQLVAQMKKGQ